MLWLEAKLIDVGLSARVLSFGNEIQNFVRTYNGGKLLESSLEESLAFWQNERRIILPFQSNFSRIDLSFLIGVANIGTLLIACATKSYSWQKSGYGLIGVEITDNGLALIEEEYFSGFKSDKWKVFYFNDEGYSIFVHVKGEVTVWRLALDRNEKSLFLLNNRVFASSDRKLFEAKDESKIIFAMRNRPGLDADDIVMLAKLIYDIYVASQRFRELGDIVKLLGGSLRKKETGST